MKFIVVINREIKFGTVLNAVGHMTLGLGHRLEGEPDVGIYFANSSTVRAFRQLAATITKEQSALTAFTDYPHTMHGSDTFQQLELGKTVAEADMQYYGACFITEQLDSRMEKVLSACSKLKGYLPHISKGEAKLLPSQPSLAANKEMRKKIMMLINDGLPLAQSLNAALLATLSVGGRAAYADLGLLDWMDKDDNAHSNISFHPFPILKPVDPIKHSEMAQKAKASTLLVSDIRSTADGQPLVTVAFGNESDVGEVAPRALAKLFDKKMKDSDFVSATGTELSASVSVVEEKKVEDKPRIVKGTGKAKAALFSAGDKSVSTTDVSVENPELKMQ